MSFLSFLFPWQEPSKADKDRSGGEEGRAGTPRRTLFRGAVRDGEEAATSVGKVGNGGGASPLGRIPNAFPFE